MSNTDLIIEERSRDIGDFLVGRLIPFRQKRMVGPFIFIDHMGPSRVEPGNYMDIGQHPHIGLSTLTYLFEGELMHEDSLGTKQRIAAGSVNWMTGGKGVVHTERTPQDMRNGQEFTVHGYQVWVALPKEKEEIDPSFHHVAKEELPSWQEGDLSMVLVAGKAYGKESPVPVHSPLFMIDVKSKSSPQLLETGSNLFGEIGICVVKGYIEACGQRVEAGNMLVSKAQEACKLTVGEDSHLLFFGGEPFPEQRHIFWNFVSSRQERLAEALQQWIDKDFPMVANDSSYIPAPVKKIPKMKG